MPYLHSPVQCTLRLVIGMTLLLFAATLPLRAPARSEPLDDNRSGGDLIEQVEQLFHPRQPTAQEIERRRQEDENGLRLQENALELERMLDEKEASLANVGPTFRISEVTGGLSGVYLRKACLIGETGKAYMYDVGQDAAAQANASVNEREFSQAVDLAKSLGHVEWRPLSFTSDVGVVAWTMSLDGRRTLLQIGGEYVGALPDPRVGELVKLIDRWCPYVPEIRRRLELLEVEVGGGVQPPH
jgi:hypothetical protein